MQDMTSAFVDDVKETHDPRRDTEEGHLDAMMFFIHNFIEYCMHYINTYPIAFLCYYLMFIIYACYWVYSESIMWANFTNERPPRRRDRPRLGKNPRHRRKNKCNSRVTE